MRRTLLSLLLLLNVAACNSRTGRRAESRPAAKASPVKTASPTPNPQGVVENEKATDAGEGKFNQYGFTYTRKGGEATAIFDSPRLPRYQLTVVGAAREVIRTVFRDTAEGFPRLVPWTHEGASRNGIKLEGVNHDFIFVPVEDEKREFRSLVFRRVTKGSVN